MYPNIFMPDPSNKTSRVPQQNPVMNISTDTETIPAY
jgi:hypothetical protein